MEERNFTARRPGDKRPYLVAVRYLPESAGFTAYNRQAAAIVFIRDPTRFVRLNRELLQQSYGLTCAESELACALNRGLSPGEAARERGVSITTTRSQLYSLMNKMSVNRQNDLIRLLTQYCIPFL